MTEQEKEKLILDNTDLVWHVVSKKTNRAYTRNNPLFDEEDLFQIGCLGLIKAAENFDESKGYRFSTYAETCIRNEIFKELESSKDDSRRAIEGCELEENSVVEERDIMSSAVNLLIDDLTEYAGSRTKYEPALRILLKALSEGYRLKEAAELTGISYAKASHYVRAIRAHHVA